MRLIAITLAIAAACGPSAKEVETAKAARYRGPAIQIFDIAESVAQGTFKLYDSDPDQYVFMTLPKWYSPDGQSESAGVGNAVKVEDGSFLVGFLVQIVEEENARIAVNITPVVERFRMGQSTHDKLAADDPSIPGWIHGKADSLAVAIHARAKDRLVAP